MTARPFRFGVVATPTGGQAWLATARRVEELGYATLLMPDVAALPDPFAALAMAAGATTRLRVGTFVLAGPVRTPQQAARAGHSLSLLSGGRFDFGIGTGRPDAAGDAARVGMPFGSAEQRLADVAAAIDALRALDGATTRTPVLIAAGGPRARALAGARADIVTLAAGPLAARDEVAAQAAEVRAAADGRADSVELAMNLFVIGEEVPPPVQGFLKLDAATLIAHDSLTMLRGTPAEMADELQRRRDALGVSYICVNSMFGEQFAPVLERLDGH